MALVVRVALTNPQIGEPFEWAQLQTTAATYRASVSQTYSIHKWANPVSGHSYGFGWLIAPKSPPQVGVGYPLVWEFLGFPLPRLLDSNFQDFHRRARF